MYVEFEMHIDYLNIGAQLSLSACILEACTSMSYLATSLLTLNNRTTAKQFICN